MLVEKLRVDRLNSFCAELHFSAKKSPFLPKLFEKCVNFPEPESFHINYLSFRHMVKHEPKNTVSLCDDDDAQKRRT